MRWRVNPKHLPCPGPVWPSPCPLLSLPAFPSPTGLPALSTHSPPAEVQGALLPQQDEDTSSTLFSQVKDSLSGYWDTAKTAAHSLYQKTYLPTMDEKIRYHPTSTPGTRSPSP